MTYINAPRLLEAVASNIAIEQNENQEDIEDDIYFRNKDWFCDYAIDYFDDNFDYEHSIGICKRFGPFDDEDDWENLIRNEIEKQLKTEFDETTIKEHFIDYLDADIASILLVENYSEEMDDAIDNYIWNLDIPDQESIFEPYSKLVQPSDETHENLIVEKLFNEYHLLAD